MPEVVNNERESSHKTVVQEMLETEQQLGIPFVNLDMKNPYIPKKRIVHLDLKGAPPRIEFLRKLFPMLKTIGATGILLGRYMYNICLIHTEFCYVFVEYEDMFPFDGILKNISAKNAYTLDQIREIQELAELSKFEVMPLIQTFGHLEFALKHKEWSKIREVPGSPQAVCPSRNTTLDFISELVTQVRLIHYILHNIGKL